MSSTRIARKGAFSAGRRRRALGVPAIVHTVHGAPFHPYQSALAREFCSPLRTLGGRAAAMQW